MSGERNDVTIHVKAQDDNTGKVFKKVKEDAKRGGAAAGDEFAGSFSGQLMANKAEMGKAGDTLGKETAKGAEKAVKAARPIVVPVVADNPVDAAWRAKVQASIKSVAGSALDIPVTLETSQFRRDLEVALKKASGLAAAKIPVQPEDAAKFRAQLEAMVAAAATGVKANIPVEVDEDEIDKLVNRTNKKFGLISFAALSSGLPAAALVGAVATGAILAAVPLMFGAVAAAALTNNDTVASSWKDTAQRVKNDTYAMALPLEGTMVKASEKVTESFVRMKPRIQDSLLASKEGVLTLTDSVLSLAENALPGMTDAAQNSEDALDGFESMMSDVGTGAGEMFSAMSEGSAGAGEGMKVTGGILHDLLGFTGELFANLANGSAGPLRDFQGTLGAVEDTALSLTSNGMPALQGVTSGFLGVVSGGVGILKMGADALGSWAGPLGSATGTLLGINSAAKLFGTSIGETGFGVRAFSQTMDASGKATTPFRQALADTDAGGSKFSRGLGSILSQGINPLGIALVGGGLLLDAYGRKQQEAAKMAAEHRENVRTLTDAIRQDNGVLGENTAKVNIDALASKNAASNLAVYGETMGTAKNAIEGNVQAYDKLKFASGAAIADIAKQSGLNETQTKNLIGMGRAALDTGQNWDQLSNAAMKAEPTLNSTGTALTNVNGKLRDQLSAIINGNGAVGEQIRAQQEAQRVYIAGEAALTGMSEAQVKAALATNEHTTAIYAQQNAQLGLRGAELNTKKALEEYDKTSKDGKASADDKAASLLKVEQSFAAQENAAYQAAFANNSHKSSSEQLTAANRAADQMLVQLATGFKGTLPESMQQTISKMSATQAQAAGMTVAINGAGNAVYRLPNGKEIVLAANTAAANSALQYFQNKLDAIHGKTVTVTTSFVDVYSSNTRSQTGQSRMFAKGGLVEYATGGEVLSIPKLAAGRRALDVRGGAHLQGPGTGTSDDMLLWGSNGEYMVKEKQTKKYLPLLKAINNDTLGFANGGMIQAEDGTWVPPSFYDKPPPGPHAIYTESGFAKVRAEAMKNGIGSLSAKDQDQLRTYGGWVDPPKQNGSTSTTLRGRQSSGGGGAPVVIELRSSGLPVDNFLMELLRNAIRVQGGNVQVVLGS